MTSTQTTGGILSEVEVESLILAVARGQDTFTEDDVRRVLDWAETTRVDAGLLDGVLAGHFSINATGETLTYRLTDAGTAYVETTYARRP